MFQRRFALKADLIAAAAPLLGVSGCGGGGSSSPNAAVPVAAGASAIRLPANHYLHRGAPTEWWWHVGTLKAGSRTFGFEINAASFAQDKTKTLAFKPFTVWGTGVKEGGVGASHLERNNYYYSLTHLQASGTITLDGVKLDVSGVTWMDHEYGAFGSAADPVRWILQDMQLDNGVSISNYSTDNPSLLRLNQTSKSVATIQRPDGTTYFEPTFITPIGRTWTSPKTGKTYFMQVQVSIPSLNALITVTNLMDAQEFPILGSPVYEGVASALGTFDGQPVSGTAWSEQKI